MCFRIFSDTIISTSTLNRSYSSSIIHQTFSFFRLLSPFISPMITVITGISIIALITKISLITLIATMRIITIITILPIITNSLSSFFVEDPENPNRKKKRKVLQSRGSRDLFTSENLKKFEYPWEDKVQPLLTSIL